VTRLADRELVPGRVVGQSIEFETAAAKLAYNRCGVR